MSTSFLSQQELEKGIIQKAGPDLQKEEHFCEQHLLSLDYGHRFRHLQA